MSAWEARVLGRLRDHPYIATVLERWEEGETAFMVSHYLAGGSLRDRIAQLHGSGTGLSLEDILRISLEVANGLAYIHGRRILYLDLQPQNVLFDDWDTVHLVDFDTAVSLEQPTKIDMSHRPAVVYMAPELTDGGDTDVRQPHLT